MLSEAFSLGSLNVSAFMTHTRCSGPHGASASRSDFSSLVTQIRQEFPLNAPGSPVRLETFLATGLDVRISVHMPQTRCDSPSCPKTSPPSTAGIVSRARASYLSFTAFSAFLSRITSRSNVSKTCRAHRGRCKTACTPCLQSLGAASRRISRMRRPLRGLAYVSLGNRPRTGPSSYPYSTTSLCFDNALHVDVAEFRRTVLVPCSCIHSFDMQLRARHLREDGPSCTVVGGRVHHVCNFPSGQVLLHADRPVEKVYHERLSWQRSPFLSSACVHDGHATAPLVEYVSPVLAVGLVVPALKVSAAPALS